MPTYQYACTACGHQLEAVQSFTDDPLTRCPACEGRLRKLFGSVGVVFKGPGFYRTDSRAGANGSVTGAGKEQGAGASKKADTGGSTGSTGSTGSSGSSGDASTSAASKPDKTPVGASAGSNS